MTKTKKYFIAIQRAKEFNQQNAELLCDWLQSQRRPEYAQLDRIRWQMRQVYAVPSTEESTVRRLLQELFEATLSECLRLFGSRRLVGENLVLFCRFVQPNRRTA